MTDVRTAIVLRGGGALGAYEYGVLRALHEQRPGFAPVAVTGVSIGAVTAAVLGGAAGDPMAALDELWRHRLTVPAPPGLPAAVDRSLALLGNPGMYRLRPFPWLQTSFYDTDPLRRTLVELPDVLGRVFQLQYSSRLKLDAAFFDRIRRLVEPVDRVDAVLPPDSDIRDDPTYRRVRAHRRIDHLNVVTSSLPVDEATTADFARASIEARIQAGYDDAVAQGIGSPRSAGLRFGTTAAGPVPVRS